ncbi:hypothetical protein I4U23_006692 [Adineta vaga]|nr:hypothetical protein I4U23_006692 [Adineta vaga]
MTKPIRIFTINTILILLIVQVNAGYWICDWVHGRGWMFCARGFCTTYHVLDKTTMVYFVWINRLATCEPFNDVACHLTLQTAYSPPKETYSKRVTETICD